MPWRLLAAIWLSSFLVSLDYTAVNVALPTLSREFAVGTSAISWIALAYLLAVVALTLPAGLAMDRIGYLRTLGASLALFAAASLASALATSLWLLVAMRALQGIGAAVMFAIGPAVIKTLFPEALHGRAFAIFSTAPTVGLLAGPLIGGQLASLLGWESIFLFSLAAALLALLLVSLVQAGAVAPLPAARTASPVSLGLAIAGLLLLLLALNRGQECGWTSPAIVVLFGTALALLISLVLHERRAAAPLVDPALFASPAFVRAGAMLFFILIDFGGCVFLMPFYLEWLRKLDPDIAGHLLMIQPAATIALTIPVALWFADASRRTLCTAGVCLLLNGFATFAVIDRDASLLMPAAGLAMMGLGRALYYQTLVRMSVAEVPDRLAASASALQATGRSLAQLLGVVLFETLFSALYPPALDAERAVQAEGAALAGMQGAFSSVYWLGTGIAALALVLAAWLPVQHGAKA